MPGICRNLLTSSAEMSKAGNCLSVGRSSGSTREYGSATAGEVSEREACSASASVAAGASPKARPNPAVQIAKSRRVS